MNPSAGDVPTVVPGSNLHNFKEDKVAKKSTKEKKIVEVHSCFDIVSQPFPSLCACRQTVPVRTAQMMVNHGEAEWIPHTDQTKVCLVDGIKRRTPRTATIDSKHIERAYVIGDLEEKHRINEYNRLTVEMLRTLIRQVPAAEYDAAEKSDWGISILPVPSTQHSAICTAPESVKYHRFRCLTRYPACFEEKQ